MNKETKIGLTYGQILATITVIAFFITAWINLNTKIAAIESRQNSQENSISEIKEIRADIKTILIQIGDLKGKK